MKRNFYNFLKQRQVGGLSFLDFKVDLKNRVSFYFNSQGNLIDTDLIDLGVISTDTYDSLDLYLKFCDFFERNGVKVNFDYNIQFLEFQSGKGFILLIRFTSFDTIDTIGGEEH